MNNIEVGDMVKVVNKGLESYGYIGKVIDIDTEWRYPYEVDFGVNSFKEELFIETDLLLVREYSEEHTNKIHDDNATSSNDRVDVKDFVSIDFQDGVVSEVGVNGAQIEDVIDLLIDRLTSFQNGGFRCKENAMSITHLQEAQNWQYRRSILRKEQGVEGKYKNHE